MSGENSLSSFILLLVPRDQTWTLEPGSEPPYLLIHLSIPLEVMLSE